MENAVEGQVGDSSNQGQRQCTTCGSWQPNSPGRVSTLHLIVALRPSRPSREYQFTCGRSTSTELPPRAR